MHAITFDAGIRCHSIRIELFYFGNNFRCIALWGSAFIPTCSRLNHQSLVLFFEFVIPGAIPQFTEGSHPNKALYHFPESRQ